MEDSFNPIDPEIWRIYFKRKADVTIEEIIDLLRQQTQFDNYVPQDYLEDFYVYLNFVLSSFSTYSRERVLSSYKQGRKMGEYNVLNNTQRKMVAQIVKGAEEYADAIDSTEGPNSGDSEGFEESFQDNESKSLEDEMKDKIK